MFLIGVIVIVSLLGSFLCSLMESSLYSMGRTRIETLRRQGNPTGEILLKFREHIDEPIAAILILNTIMNTVGATVAGALVAEHYGNMVMGFFSAIFTASVLFFSEIIPKSLGFKYANDLAPILTRPLRILIFLLWPMVRLCAIITNIFGKNLRIAIPTEEDIISMATLGAKGGSILSQEAKWVINALHLDKTRVKDIMTPLSVVRSVSEEMILNDVQPHREHWRFSRIPVHRKDHPNRVAGIVRRREVFRNLIDGRNGSRMKELMSPPIFVYQHLFANELLSLFIKRKEHLFCVKDVNGRWIGIVSLEDVLETMLGTEIVEKHDLFEDMQKATLELERARVLTQDLERAGGTIEQVISSKESNLVGKKIRESGISQDTTVGPVVRNDAVIVPSAELRLEAGDKVTLIGKKKDVEETKKRLNPKNDQETAS